MEPQSYRDNDNRMKKRVRTDRLIGVRLDPAELAEVRRRLNAQTMSMTDYLRRLVFSDLAQQQGKTTEATPEQCR